MQLRRMDADDGRLHATCPTVKLCIVDFSAIHEFGYTWENIRSIWGSILNLDPDFTLTTRPGPS